YQRTQMAFVKNRHVLNAALREPKVQELEIIKSQVNPVAWLEGQIKVDFSMAPEFMRISLSGPDPDELAPIVDAVREAYLSEIVKTEHNQRLDRLALLKEVYAKFDDKLRKNELWQIKSDLRKLKLEMMSLPDARKLAGDLPVPEYLIEEQLKKDPTYDK